MESRIQDCLGLLYIVCRQTRRASISVSIKLYNNYLLYDLFFFRKIHKVTSYFIENEIAHNFHIMRGTRCYSNPQINGAVRQEDSQRYSVLRVFLWPRNPVHGRKNLSADHFSVKSL